MVGVWLEGRDGATRFVGWTRRPRTARQALLTPLEHWSFVLVFALSYLLPWLLLVVQPIAAIILMLVLDRRELARQTEEERLREEQLGSRSRRRAFPCGRLLD